jgi:hypothetical protein
MGISLDEQQRKSADILKMRAAGAALMAIRDARRARGYQISHECVRAVLARPPQAGGAA